ncbi:MAG: LL-diaminopimelate aminotransferase [Elusimicrobiota bacterium]
MNAKRLSLLPPYLFVEIDKKKKALIEKGVDIISLGVGDPDLPTPEHIIKAGQEGLSRAQFHKYPFGPGMKDFRRVVSTYIRDRFGVELNPENQIHALIGSKEGIGHLPLAFVNPGDYVLVPEPGYPVYRSSTIFAGGRPYPMPLLEKNNFLPDFSKIPQKVLRKTRLMFLNYPNNPTAATATSTFFKEVVTLAKKNKFFIVHDAAYSEVYFNKPPVSFLSVPGAMNVGVEIHSLSKTYNMTGWRIGWICGNDKIISGLANVKDNYDSGVFAAIQFAAIAALSGPQDCVEKMRSVYRERRDIFYNGLCKSGWELKKPEATFYVWARPPRCYSIKCYLSKKAAEKLLTEAGIVATPGVGMGKAGEGYLRFALTADKQKIAQALERMEKIVW